MRLAHNENQVLAQSHQIFFNTCIFSSYAGYIHSAYILFYHLYHVCTVSIETQLFLFFPTGLHLGALK